MGTLLKNFCVFDNFFILALVSKEKLTNKRNQNRIKTSKHA